MGIDNPSSKKLLEQRVRANDKKLILSVKVFAILVTCLLSSCAEKAPLPPTEVDEFDTLKAQYFEKLDLRVSEERLKSIPAFSARLTTVADWERWKEKSGLLPSTEEKERAGLIFIYDALLVMNNTEAVGRGTFSITQLTDARRFSSPLANEKMELVTRAAYALKELSMASKLRPEDKRIDAWMAAANAALEKVKDGEISDRAIAAAFGAVTTRPSFNLLTALVLFQDEDASSARYEHVVAAAQKYVDASADGSEACKAHPEDCSNGPNAAYNLQGAAVIVGDIFLRRSEYFLEKDDLTSASQMAGYAQGTYQLLEKEAAAEATARWPDKSALELRTSRLDRIHEALVPTEPFQKHPDYGRSYECASCHGRAQ